MTIDRREYGNPPRAAYEGLLIGVLVFAGVYLSCRFLGIPGQRQLDLPLSLICGAIVPLWMMTTVVCRVVVVGNSIRHEVFGRWVVCQRPLSKLVAVHWGGILAGLQLEFADSAPMRLPGIYRHEAERISLELLGEPLRQLLV